MISSDWHSQIFEENILDQFGPKWDPKLVFCHFLKFCSLVFLKIAYSDRLQQYVTYSRGKTHERNFEAEIWAKGAEIGA